VTALGGVRDPHGNLWWIQQRVEELDPEELGRRATQPQQLDAMGYVQSSLDDEMRRRARV
jgi:PhnB protein